MAIIGTTTHLQPVQAAVSSTKTKAVRVHLTDGFLDRSIQGTARVPFPIILLQIAAEKQVIRTQRQQA
jgi:hypothetical protein